jgi:hypothetical protein
VLVRIDDASRAERAAAARRVAPPELLQLLRWLQRHVRHVSLAPGATGDLHVDLSGAPRGCGAWQGGAAPSLRGRARARSARIG